MLKDLIPISVRDQFRPGYQQLQRVWDESQWKRRPRQWHENRRRVWGIDSLDALLKEAYTEFGLSQIYSEARELLNALRALQPRTIVEVGTHKGGNSFLFCQALRSVQLVIGIDLHVQNAGKIKFFSRRSQRFVALHGDSQVPEMRQRVEKILAGRPIDFLFIDGDHSYEGVRVDFESYSPLVRPGGLVALHDIVPDHKTRFGRDTECYSGEVYKYWEELKRNHESNREIIEDANQDGFGIGIVSV